MPAFNRTEDLASVPEFGNSGPFGFGLTLWGDPASDDNIYRQLLESFASEFPDIKLSLPPWGEYEDLIEGSMEWDGHPIAIWFETALTHLSLWSANQAAMISLRSAIVPFAERAGT